MGRNRKWIQIAILAVILAVGGYTIGSSLFKGSGGIPGKGDKALDFTTVGLDGKPYKLADLKGKPAVLNFWGTFCPPCREEMPALQNQANKWEASGVRIIGMNIGENAVTVKGFADQLKIRFPIYMDEGESIRKKYGVMNYPTTFFIRSDGTIHEIKVGQMDEAYIDQTITALLAASK